MPAWQGPPCTCFAAVTGASGQLSADARGQLWSAASQRPCWCLAGPAWAPGTAPPLSWEETWRKEQTLEMPTSRSTAQWRTEGEAALGVGGTGCQGRAAPPPPLSTPLPGLTTPRAGRLTPSQADTRKEALSESTGVPERPPTEQVLPLEDEDRPPCTGDRASTVASSPGPWLRHPHAWPGLWALVSSPLGDTPRPCRPQACSLRSRGVLTGGKAEAHLLPQVGPGVVHVDFLGVVSHEVERPLQGRAARRGQVLGEEGGGDHAPRVCRDTGQARCHQVGSPALPPAVGVGHLTGPHSPLGASSFRGASGGAVRRPEVLAWLPPYCPPRRLCASASVPRAPRVR